MLLFSRHGICSAKYFSEIFMFVIGERKAESLSFAEFKGKAL